MAVAAHARGRQASLACSHFARQAQRSICAEALGGRSEAAPSEGRVGAGFRALGGDHGVAALGSDRWDRGSHQRTRSTSPVPRVPAPTPVPSLRPPTTTSSRPLVSARESSPRVFAGDDETGQSNRVSLRGGAGATADASAVRVRLRPRPASACRSETASGGPEREAAPLLASRVGRGGRQVCAVQAPPRATLSTLTSSGGVDGFCTEGGRIRWGESGRGRRGWRSGVGSGGDIGILRGLASASSDPEPEQYLRYIHRVKPEDPPDDEEDAVDVMSTAQNHGNGVGFDERRSRRAERQADLDMEFPSTAPASSSRFAAVTARSARSRGQRRQNPDEDDAVGSGSRMAPTWLRDFTVEDILRDKTLLRQQLEVPGNCTVDEAVTSFVNEKVTSFVVVNRRKEVIGMFTSRDLLGELARYPNKADGLRSKAHQFMIPLSQMIYCSPKDSLYQCLLVMSELKVRNLPVVHEGKVLGIVNVNDISDFSFSMEEIGGKKAYMKNVSERKGLPKGVSLDSRQNRPGWKQAFSASVGVIALPHPHKMADGKVSAAIREHRHREIAEDPALSEDAHFVLDIAWPTATTDTVHYVGIADGVGSWRKVGVDPRQFSLRLMHWAREYILSMSPSEEMSAHMTSPPPKPHQVLSAAWEYTIGEKVVGSSTACIAALDYDLEQLTFSNIGDCGVVVLRHIDSDVAGYMREKKTPRHLRDSDLRIAFISQQQLRSFNLPYQFGYTNVPEGNANFETPRDAVNTSFPVRPGDIILLATDGLFDNMELDDICSVALRWEYKWFGGPMRGLSEHNNAAMDDLAQQLGNRARELSLDSTRDSPFALLAKENDIMWGGGMPDDITIVAVRVINRGQSSVDAISKRGVGHDDQDVDEAA